MIQKTKIISKDREAPCNRCETIECKTGKALQNPDTCECCTLSSKYSIPLDEFKKILDNAPVANIKNEEIHEVVELINE